MDPEVPQMKIEDRSFKFDVFSIKVIVRTGRSGLTGPIFITFQIVVSCTWLPGFILLFAHVIFRLVFIMLVVT